VRRAGAVIFDKDAAFAAGIPIDLTVIGWQVIH
jgi:hypothetical protein